MNIPLYNQEAEVIRDIQISDSVFGISMNSDLLHQIVVSQQANRRQVVAHAKDRSEVHGGGRKPWRQKGTGRARHGSIRSPIWKGGGATHGPTKKRNFSKKINRKMARKALAVALSAKIKDNQLFVLDAIKLEQPKTKIIAKIFNNISSIFPVFSKSRASSVLLVLPGDNTSVSVRRAATNIPRLSTMRAEDLNALAVLSVKYVVMLENSIRTIEKLFTIKKS